MTGVTLVPVRWYRAFSEGEDTINLTELQIKNYRQKDRMI